MQGFRDRGEEQAIAVPGIGTEQGVERVGHGEDDVVILDGQEMLLLRFEPTELMAALALGTVPVPAGVVGYLAVIAAVTLIDVTAERRGTAVEDGPHHARLPTIETRHRVGALTEDVGQLDFRSISTAALDRRARHASALRWRVAVQVGKDVERTGCVVEVVPGDVGVDLCGLQAAVAQEQLDLTNVDPAFE